MKLLSSFTVSILILLFQFCCGNRAVAQLKDYTISPKGDTINGLNKNGEKQGKWVIRTEEVRGEPGFEEEGEYNKGKKEGPWRVYNLNSDLIGMEFYKFGGKDGLQQYFTYLGDLIREEEWRGYNPDAPYDTIPVYGTGSNEIVNFKIVKAEQYSVKNGEWKYFEPGSGRLLKSEIYDHNRLVTPNSPAVVLTEDKPKKKVEKTPEMLEWEKKNKGKKKVVRDGAVGL